MRGNLDSVGKYLMEHNIKPSYPRIKVMEYLLTRKNHPTVEQIYEGLVKEIPTLSKTTVYNTLSLFTDAKIARSVTIEDNEVRYDADISNHGHFKCDVCGNVFDFHVKIEDTKTEGLEHFDIRERNVYYKGTCSTCLNDNNNKN